MDCVLHLKKQQVNKQLHACKGDKNDSNNNNYIYVRSYVLVSYIREVPHKFYYCLFIYIYMYIYIYIWSP